MLKGIAASPGVVTGKAFVMDSEDVYVVAHPIREPEIPGEISRFEEALTKTRDEILRIEEKISAELGDQHGNIFRAHRRVLEDTALVEEVITTLKKEKICVEHVFWQVLQKYVAAFSKMGDEYFKERATDIKDVGKRVLKNLVGAQKEALADLEEEVIVIAYNLSPSDTALMHREKVIGFATDIGSRTSHTAIMARSLAIPAVVGLQTVTKEVRNGDTLIIDGNHGIVVINPDEATIVHYKGVEERFHEFEKSLQELRDLPAETPDGHIVQLSANIEFPEEIASCIAHGAQGIGLYRTEYFYMNRTDLPTEEEHYQAYRSVAEHVRPYPVIVRTLDLGGDKFVSQLEVPREMNPFLGWRAIRFCLARPDIFKTQLRAILRASVHGKLKVMYPMISGLEELKQANAMFEEAKEELRKSSVAFDENMEVGAMIEIPSAALTCDLLAKEVDFFSIGTNDLIQYALAVDRVNEKIAYLYEPAHPGVVRLIKSIIDSAHANGIRVGMCGEMAGEPALAILLLGLGLDEFSTSYVITPEIKKVIRSVKFSDAKKIAEEVLKLSTGEAIETYLDSKLTELVPSLVD